jgi:hypothetical protein
MPTNDRRPGGTAADTAEDGAAPGDVDAAVADLYGGPPASFVARRDAVARALRSAGRRDDAAEVKALRKPKRLAWALDAARLADPSAVESLAGAVESATDAQSTGGDFRAAIARVRDAEHDLVDVAARAAHAHDQRVDRSEIGLAIRAVAADHGALAALRSGRLVDVPATGGLGGFGDLLPDDGPVEPAGRLASERAAEEGGGDTARAGTDPASSRALAAARRAVKRAEAAAATAEDTASDAAERAEAAEETARQAERGLAAAAERADEARRAAADAQRTAAAAAADRDEAAQALADARSLIRELER